MRDFERLLDDELERLRELDAVPRELDDFARELADLLRALDALLFDELPRLEVLRLDEVRFELDLRRREPPLDLRSEAGISSCATALVRTGI